MGSVNLFIVSDLLLSGFLSLLLPFSNDSIQFKDLIGCFEDVKEYSGLSSRSILNVFGYCKVKLRAFAGFRFKPDFAIV